MAARQSRRKTKTSSTTPGAATIRALRAPAALAFVLTGGFFAAWYFCWYGVAGWKGSRHWVLSQPDYWVTPDEVVITPPPDWIRTDVRGEVLRDARLNGPTWLLEADLVDRMAAAFELHPWVARVRRVRKRHPGRVEVELEYRRPVCMVELASGLLLPVDAYGVLLPSEDFSPVEAARYPRLTGVSSRPAGPPGTAWGDQVVVAGAGIAAVLQPVWDELRLERILPLSDVGGDPGQSPAFEVFTRSGTRIIWGHGPASGLPGELSAEDKLAVLKKYYTEHGTLDGPTGPQVLDLERLRVRSTAPGTAAAAATRPR